MNTKICPTCKAPIPANAPGGLCPACVLRDADELPPIGRAAPSLAEISAAFPQLEVLGLIGQGGMGFVYKARQPSLDRTVALKILSPELSRDPAFAERFAREARVLGKLNHPNIVTVFEHGTSQSSTLNSQPFFYLIMEHVDGVNLRQAMRAGRFTPQQALAVVPGICDALQAAHAQGVWHRDIKPENILLDARGGVKIADFGIARIVGDPQRDFTLTATGAALGSAAYMAPEQHEKPHDVDHRADIYSLGVVIYEMLTGELPLGRFPAPSARAAVDARIDEIVFRTLEKERELRQQSAAEVKTDMTSAASTPAKSQTLAASPLGQLPKLVVRSLALLICGAVVGGTGWFVMANFRNAAAGGAVIAGFGALALIFGLIGSLWSLYEMKRGWMPPIGRRLLIGLLIVPAAIGCGFLAGASSLETVPSVKGSILILMSLIIGGLGIAFWLIFKLARPRTEATPLRANLARASLVGSVIALVACAVLAKRSDSHWPHVFNKETATLHLNRDGKPDDEKLLALLKKAAGPNFGAYELSAKNGKAKVTAVSKEFQPYMQFGYDSIASALSDERKSHAQACLARLRDLLPPLAIHESKITTEFPSRSHTSQFFLGRSILGLLATLGVLFAALAGGRRAVKIIAAGIALHVALIFLPVWNSENDPQVVEGAPLPMFTAAELTASNGDFFTPDKAVTSVYEAACWGNREAARRGMSKALVAGLDAQDGWDEFFERNVGRRMVSTFLPTAKPDRFYNQYRVKTSYINRTGTPTSGDDTWVVQEDGEWRLDQLTYVGKKGEITAPATWFANKNAADAAKKAADSVKVREQPAPKVVPFIPATPTESAESVFRKLNTLANESNGDEFRKLLDKSLASTTSVPMSRRMEKFYGRPTFVKQTRTEPASSSIFGKIPAKTILLAALEDKDGKTNYMEFHFIDEDGAWRFSSEWYPKWRSATRIEFRPEKGDALAILRSHVTDRVKIEPIADKPGEFQIIATDNTANGARADASNRTSDLRDSLKKAGLDATFKILAEAPLPAVPIDAEEATPPALLESAKPVPAGNLPSETKPMLIHFLPGNRIEVDGKAATPDELVARLKQPNDGKPKWRFEVQTEAGIEGRFIADVLQKMKSVGAKFDDDVVAKLRDSMKEEEAKQPAPLESATLEAPGDKSQKHQPELNIKILPEDRIELDGKPISLDDLAKRMKPLAASGQTVKVSVSQESGANLGHIVRVNETMLKSGVKLEPGYMDKVLRTFTYSMSGQVTKPARRFFPEEPITVSKAVTLAGGPTGLGALDKVLLERTDAAGATKTIIVDVKKVLEGKATKDEDPVVEAGDKITVPELPPQPPAPPAPAVPAANPR